MSHKTAATGAQTIGIDTGKNTLHLIGLDDKGAIVLREKVSRGRIAARFANVPRCLVGIEAGMATHYVARELSALGHDVRKAGTACLCQTVPARSLGRLQRRPRDRGSCAAAVDTLRSSEDRRSARSISAAPGAISPGWPTNGCDQSDPRLSLGAWHCGTSGASLPRQQLPDILAKRGDVLSPRMIRIMEDLSSDLATSRRAYPTHHRRD
jgi:transposase